jgi:hypothetical protein
MRPIGQAGRLRPSDLLRPVQVRCLAALQPGWRKGRELNPQGSSLDALAPRCRRLSAGPSVWSRMRDSHPHHNVLQTRASLLGLCDRWGDVPELNRRRLGHSQASWPLDEHPHVSCGERARTFALRFQRPAFVPAQTTPHRMAPPRGFKPRPLRLEDARAIHLRHGGEWCIWQDSNLHMRRV